MRILHISTRLILGGSQENTVLSCEGQARLGHEVHLAFGPIYGPEGSLLERVQELRTSDGRGITTHVVPHMIREVSPLSDRRAFTELYTLILELQPDIIHTHSSKAGILGRAAAWAARRDYPRTNFSEHAQSSTPSAHTLYSSKGSEFVATSFGPGKPALPAIIHTIHGPPFMPVEGSLPRRAKIGFNNWLYTRAEKYAAKRCHTIVSVADAMTSQFLARGIGRPEQYVTVRSGMEIEPFLSPRPGETREDMRAQLGIAPDDLVIGTVARLAQHKGHDDLLDALTQAPPPGGRGHGGGFIPRANTPSKIKLLWIGDGWWRERLLAKARTLGLSVTELDKPDSASSQSAIRNPQSQIILTGLVPPDRIPALMRAMDILAHPSSREGLPRTVPQALLSNVCPVAYDVDGTGEVCRDMQTGRLVPHGDKAKLREAILWLADHPRERAAMAARGREECRVAFSADTMVSSLEKVYEQAIERAQA